MIDTPDYTLTDEDRARALVRDHGWALLVSSTGAGIVASHVPVLLEEGEPFSVLGHVGRPDEELHRMADGREVMLVVDGPHGYVSPGWYGYTPAVPTWNYVSVHLYGTIELLDAHDTYEVLTATVDRYEGVMPEPVLLDGAAADYAVRVARGAAGFRLHVTRWQGKAKLSQDKPREVAERVVKALADDPHYANPALADAVRAELDRREVTA